MRAVTACPPRSPTSATGVGQSSGRESGLAKARRYCEGEFPVRLESDDGAVVELRPQRYQFGSSSTPRDWDANWLIVAGRATLADGRSWSFSDPSLTTWEARELASWLRGVLAGDVEPAPFGGEEDERLLVFTEPNLGFSLAGREAERVTLRCHLSLESRPPWLLEDTDSDLFDFFIEVSTPHSALAAAADEWEREISAFPVR